MTTRRWLLLLACTLSVASACSGAEDGTNADGSRTDGGGLDSGGGGDTGGGDTGGGDLGGGGDVPRTGVVVRINEVAAAGEPEDWFELTNVGDETANLSGWTLSDSLDEPGRAAFPAGTTLAPGGYLVFEATDEGFGFKLGGDEELGVWDGSGELVDSVDWDEGDSPEGGSYSRIPDGLGPFRTVLTATRGATNRDGSAGGDDGDDAGDMGGDDTGDVGGDDAAGDGGVGDGGVSAGLVINEVAAAGEPDDWFELYNGGDVAVDLNGWSYTDDLEGEPGRALFSAGTMLDPGDYLLVSLASEDPGFSLGGDEELTIQDADGRVVDRVDWDEDDSPEGGSFARIPNGTGAFKTVLSPTPGAANVDEGGGDEDLGGGGSDADAGLGGDADATAGGDTGSEDGGFTFDLAFDFAFGGDADATGGSCVAIITEVMHGPDSDSDFWEWFEVYNAGDGPCTTEGWVTDDTNGSHHGEGNVASATIEPGEAVVFFNADGLSAVAFADAWSGAETECLVGVTGWDDMKLSADDTLVIWSSFASYDADISVDDDVTDSALLVLDMSAGFPSGIAAGASIYVTAEELDWQDGASWAASAVGVAGAALSTSTGGDPEDNTGGDLGSPCSVPW
jgi:hypothetical protein